VTDRCKLWIEEVELLAHARRVYLAFLASPAGVERAATERAVLEADQRLDGAVLLEWELRPEVDAVLLRALAHTRQSVEADLERNGVPAEHLAQYAKERRSAIDRLTAKLRKNVS